MWNLRRSCRAGVVLLIGALALVLSQPAGGAAAPAPSQARGTEPVATPLRIVTFNTAAGVGPGKAMTDLRTVLAQEPDVVALQEMSSWKKRKRIIDQVICGENGVDGGAEVPTTCAYAGWVPIPAVQGGLPILWRKDKFQLMGHDWVLAAPETYVGARGAGPSTMHAKYVVRVRLKDLATGRNIWVLNTHFVPTVQKSSGGRNANKRRIALYARHMTALKTMVAELRTKGLVFVTGDFNVNYRKDKVARDPVFPYVALRSVGLTPTFGSVGEPRTGTHVLGNGFDKRLIDYVQHRTAPARLQVVGHRIVRGLHSDHRPLVADFRVLGKGCYQNRTVIC